jgi:hypothetical protein
MTKYDKLKKGYRIEFRMMETKKVDDNTTSEQLRFYISPVYETKEAVSKRMDELQNDEEYYDGVVVSLKILDKR